MLVMPIVLVRIVIGGPSIDGNDDVLIICNTEAYPGVTSIVN